MIAMALKHLEMDSEMWYDGCVIIYRDANSNFATLFLLSKTLYTAIVIIARLLVQLRKPLLRLASLPSKRAFFIGPYTTKNTSIPVKVHWCFSAKERV